MGKFADSDDLILGPIAGVELRQPGSHTPRVQHGAPRSAGVLTYLMLYASPHLDDCAIASQM